MNNARRAFLKAAKKEEIARQNYTDAAIAYNEAYTQKRDKGIFYYDETYRKDIYEKAKSGGFSASDLEIMQYYLSPEHWNQDEVCSSGDTYSDAVDLFYKAEQYLNENTPHKSIGSTLKTMIASVGDHLDKEGDDNDN